MESKDYDDDNIIIEIRKGMEHELYIQRDVSDPRYLMYPAYAAARKAMREIVRSASRWHKSHSDDRNCKARGLTLYGFANNIMIFSAERGQGKTSAMLSFTGALASETIPDSPCDTDDIRERSDFFLQERKDGNRFYVLPPIDPTMLGSNENIVCLVLSKLYQEINDAWNSSNHDFIKEGREKRVDSRLDHEMNLMGILEEIQKCYDCLGAYSEKSDMHHTNMNKDEFDSMLLLGDAFNLKEMLYDIISFFFSLKGKNWPIDKSFLVVQMDDTDLQFENAYSLLEDVRKYLSVPNVIVVMAGDVEQLSDILRQHYRKSCDQLSSEKVNNLTIKYIDKLFPSSQRIYLPTMKQQREMGRKVQLIIYDDDINSRRFLLIFDSDNCYKDLEAEFFKDIYSNTGVIFLKYNSGLHRFIPTALREMLELYSLLKSMTLDMIHFAELGESFRAINDITRNNMVRSLFDQRENIRIFENYFMQDWCSSKLDSDACKILREIDKLAPVDRFKYVWGKLQLKFKDAFSTLSGDSSNSEQAHHNDLDLDHEESGSDSEADDVEGYVDLMRKLDSGSFNFTNELDYNFLFAVRTYFTIQFMKCSVSDEFRSIREWKSGDDFYFCSYKDLFFSCTGEELNEENQCSVIDSYIKFGKDLSSYLSGKNKTSYYSYSKDVPVDEFSLLEDLMHLLFSDFKSFDSKEDQPQYDILVLQRQLFYICFDWDVQDQFIKALPVLKTKDFGDDYSIEMLRALIDQINSSVGTQLDIYFDGPSNSLLDIKPFEILDGIVGNNSKSVL